MQQPEHFSTTLMITVLNFISRLHTFFIMIDVLHLTSSFSYSDLQTDECLKQLIKNGRAAENGL